MADDWRSRARVVSPEELAQRRTALAPPEKTTAEQLGETFAPKSQAGTALRSFGQGASLGFADELAGVGAAVDEFSGRYPVAGQVLKTAVPLLRIASLGGEGQQEYEGRPLGEALRRRYASTRDAERRAVKQGREENPKTALASALLGGVAMPAGNIGKVKTVADFARAAKVAAPVGAAAGLGGSESGSVLGDAGNALLGAAVSSVAAPIVGAVTTRGGEALKAGLSRLASESALKAIGLKAGITNKMKDLGYQTADDARELGKAALDLGLVKAGRPVADVQMAARGYRDDVYGPAIGGLYREADDAVARRIAEKQAAAVRGEPVEPEWLGVDLGGAVTKARKAIGDVAGPGEMTAAARAAEGPAQTRIAQIEAERLAGTRGFERAGRLKSDMGRDISYKAMDQTPLRLEQQRAVVRALKEQINEDLEKTLPGRVDDLRALNKRYGQVKDIIKLSDDEATRQFGRATVTPMELATALSAAGSGGLGAAAAPLALKLAGSRLPSILAVAQRAGSQAAGTDAAQWLTSQAGRAALIEALRRTSRPGGPVATGGVEGAP